VEYFRRRRDLWLGARVVWLADEHLEGLLGFRRAVREQVQEFLWDSCSE
jgi:hypothetical protein